MKREFDPEWHESAGEWDGEHFKPIKLPDYDAIGRTIENDVRPKLARLDLARDQNGDLYYRLYLFNRINLTLHRTLGRLLKRLWDIPFNEYVQPDVTPLPGYPRGKPDKRPLNFAPAYLLTKEQRKSYAIAVEVHKLDLTRPEHHAQFRGLVERLDGGRNGVAKAAARKRADEYIDRVLNPSKYRA